MKTLVEFQQFYEQTLRGELKGLEQKRKSVQTTLAASGSGIVIVVVLLAFFKISVIVTGFIGAAVWFVVYHAVTSGYKKEFKPVVIKRIVDFAVPGLAYEPDKCIPETVFLASRIFLRTPDRYRGDDLIYGKIGETRIHCSEVHAEYKTESTDSKGQHHTHWHTIFRGLFFTADFNKSFNGSTVVLPDFARSLLGDLGTVAQSWNILRGELIRLEDPEFEKLFVVYGNDQVEARYLLSPSLMRRITDFKNKSGKQVFLSFVESKVCVAVSYNRPLFEPAVSKTLLDFDSLLPYFEDLHLAAGIVDDFNLNTRIWAKTQET
jgi:hypothetical protein